MGFTSEQEENIKKTGQSGYLFGEFFHTGYLHTGADNELTERCRQIGKAVWAENAKVYHDHPVQALSPSRLPEYTSVMDDVYRLAYDKEHLEHDRVLLKERSEKFGFPFRGGFGLPRAYPKIEKFADLREKIPDAKGLRVLNVGVGTGESLMMQQLPFFRFKQLDHIDVYPPYLDAAKKTIWDAEKTTFTVKDIRDIDSFDDWDLVLLFDLVEHLGVDEAKVILTRVKHAIVFAPIETEFKQNETGVPSEEHNSFWIEEDFQRLGFKTELIKNFHHIEDRVFDAVWAVK